MVGLEAGGRGGGYQSVIINKITIPRSSVYLKKFTMAAFVVIYKIQVFIVIIFK